MESFYIWSAVSFVILILFSAFFSSSETALFSLTRSDIEAIAQRKNEPNAARLVHLLEDPRKLLIVLLSGNTIVNILAATVTAMATSRLMGGGQYAPWVVYAVQAILVTLVLLIVGEFLPKFLAIRNPVSWSMKIATPLTIVKLCIAPITSVMYPVSEFLARGLGVERRKLWITEEEIKTLVEVGEEHGALDQSEREMIHSIFEFGDIVVREIMIPRTDMVCVPVETSLEEVLDLFQTKGHSRLPVYEDRIDNIIGILHSKDLMSLYPFTQSIDLRKILRKPFFVPEGKRIDELLKQFQSERIHMAIAVDEHGGTAGLVTLEDVIEEIVGEIQDEHDKERPLWTRIDENTCVIDAKLDVETVNEVLGEEILPEDEDFETLGGFLLEQLGDFPEVNTKIEYHNYEFIIEEVSLHRLGRVRVLRHEALSDANGIGTVEP
ncbi:hemolysin family protein [bacterium]|nr:hemolysin family protein [bacterium]MBU1920176.1 hemolysin family protein [bacterium]